MASTAAQLRDYYVLQGIGSAATSFYGQDMPSEPDELTFFRDSPAFAPQEFLGTTDLVETCGLQVLVRAASDAAGQTRADATYDFLRKINNVTLSGTRYLCVQASSPIFALGRDADDIKSSGASGRPAWSLNFLVQRDRA
jgi:hypothetical protein